MSCYELGHLVCNSSSVKWAK